MTTEIVVGQWWIQNRSKRSWQVTGFAGPRLVRLRSRSGSLTMVAREVLLREYTLAGAQVAHEPTAPAPRPTFSRIRKALEHMRDHGPRASADAATEALADLGVLEKGAA